ncbi:MAG: hypothetical protein IAI49_07295 [Candidatus Eremiobacteraeota bacterium]|nr:hypothetical protein [Candidatus Eremiobacteraeota bacterium]
MARAGIEVPLMIMRSDGGVMDVAEVARRPILTMLSGPAAGIAGALLHENVTDGIFVEVGGTSADCSVIRRGLPQMQPARVGGHRTMLRTLDVRTLAIAGGSIVRVDPRGGGAGALRGVGPRSAHIAGLAYSCFVAESEFADARVGFVQPKPGDPSDYLALELASGARATLTPTCAANLLGYVPEGDFARGNAASARRAFALVAARLNVAPEALARAVLERAAATLRAAIDELIADYDLARSDVELVGGGGGAAALVPFAARFLGLRYRIARDAEVISPLGVALALVRDVVERTIVAPTPDDIVRVRREALDRVVAAGASPASTVVTVDIDARRNLVRATASGATAAVSGNATAFVASDGERVAAAARTLAVAPHELRLALRAGEFVLFEMARGGDGDICVVDARGIVRVAARRAALHATTALRCEAALALALETATSYGDVGRALPDVYLVYGSRVADLGTLAEASQVVALAAEELRGLDDLQAVAIVTARKRA